MRNYFVLFATFRPAHGGTFASLQDKIGNDTEERTDE